MSTARDSIPPSPAFEAPANGAQFRDRIAARLEASPEATFRAVRSVRLSDMPLARLAGDLRYLPSRFAGRRSVRATRAESIRALPGDALIPRPIGVLTHAVTIRRQPEDVWPWLAQMGAGERAGWYSYDLLDNGRQPSARVIRPELQSLSAGMVFPALPGRKDGFTLLSYVHERYLIVGWQTPAGALLMTWSFVLEHRRDGATRLIVRVRGGPGYHFHHLPWWIAKWVVRMIHFVMQRKQLLGIARRAEHA
jgi:hypothetical protein